MKDNYSRLPYEITSDDLFDEWVEEGALNQYDFAVALRREGKTNAHICKMTGLSYYQLKKLYADYNIPAPSRYGQTRKTILAMLDEGRLNQNQIAKHLGVSRQLVSEIKLHEQKKGVDNE